MEVFNLNIRPGKACPVLHCSQFDKGRMFRANLFDGAEVFTLTGSETLSVIEKKTDGNMVTIGVANTSDSYVVFGTTEQMTALAGCQLCELRIVDGEDLIGSLNFLLDCEESPDTGIESESAIHNLQEQIGEAVAEQYAAEDVVFDAAPVAGHGTGFAVTSEGVKTYVEGEIAALTIPGELDDLSDVTITTPSDDDILVYQNGEWVNMANPASTANFGPDYDENTTYNTGDKCVYNNLLYECNDDGVTGTWDATKWDSLTVASMTDNNLPHYTGTPTAGSTAEAIGDLQDKFGWVDATSQFTKESAFDAGQTSYFLYNEGLNMYAVAFAVKASTADNSVVLSSVPKLKNDIMVLPTGFANAGGLSVTQASVVYFKANDNIVLRISPTTNVPVFVTAFLLKA